MVLNLEAWCDVAQSAEAAARELRAAGVVVTTAGTWQAPLVNGSSRAVEARLRGMLLAVVEENRLETTGGAGMEGTAEVACVRAVMGPDAPGSMRVEVTCGRGTRAMTLPVMGAVLV